MCELPLESGHVVMQEMPGLCLSIELSIELNLDRFFLN